MQTTFAESIDLAFRAAGASNFIVHIDLPTIWPIHLADLADAQASSNLVWSIFRSMRSIGPFTVR